MRVAHVFFKVSVADRQGALGALVAEAPTVRAMKGCLAFVPFADPTDAETLGVLHEWESDDDFTAYLASPEFARSGKILRPMMTAAPISRRFDAEVAETVN